MDKLTVSKALDDAAAWLHSAERLWNSDDNRVQAHAAAAIAQAYAMYAIAKVSR